MINTRAYDATWEAGDAIGVTQGSATSTKNQKYVTTSGDGNFTPLGNRYYYTSTVPVLFSAYYPYTATTTDYSGTNKVSIAENGEQTAEKQKQIDFLFASQYGSMANPQVNFEFKHMMSQVQFKFLSGGGSPSLDGLSYTLSGMYLKGNFTPTSGVTPSYTSSYSSNKNEEAKITVTPDDPTVATSLILFPGSLLTKNTLNLAVKTSDNNYTIELNLPKTIDDVYNNGQLVAGYSILYTITVNNSYLEVTNASIVDWNVQEASASVDNGNVDPIGESTASMYALALADGSFINIYDSITGEFKSDYTTTTDGKTTLNFEKLTTKARNAVVGIVYSLKNAAAEDMALAKDYPDCTHGLIVSLAETKSDTQTTYNADYTSNTTIYPDIMWSWSDYNLSGFYKNLDKPVDYMNEPKYENYGSDAVGSYRTVGLVNDNDNTYAKTKLNLMLGYNNTKIIKDYNNNCAYGYDVRVVTAATQYSKYHQSPKGSSGWYVPSPKELVLLCNSSTNDIEFGAQSEDDANGTVMTNINNILTALSNIDEIKNKYSVSNRNGIYTYLGTINGAISGDSNTRTYLWSSSEYVKYVYDDKGKITEVNSPTYAYYVSFKKNSYGSVNSEVKHSGNSGVRFVAAF